MNGLAEKNDALATIAAGNVPLPQRQERAESDCHDCQSDGLLHLSALCISTVPL